MKKIKNKNILTGVAIIFALCLCFMYPAYSQKSATPPSNHIWPPVKGQPYPDLELISHQGQRFNLSELKGKIIIIEPLGMNCPACQAFSGAHSTGAFGGNAVQPGLPSIKELMPSYAGISLPHNDIIFVQLILYDMKNGAPTEEDAAKWAQHFGFSPSDNEVVAVSPYDMRSKASYAMIPGFQLIDKNFILRSDATGHRPQDELYRQFLPMVGQLAKQ